MAVERFTPFLVLSCAIRWTTGKSGLKANALYPSLILLHTMINRLQVVIVAYNRVAALVGPHNRIQAFLSQSEIRRYHTNVRPIQISIDHSLINDSALHPTDEKLKQIRSTRNNDQLQLNNITVKTQGVAKSIFRDVSVSIPRGKLTAVIGPTASGKTLFLRVLLGEVYCAGGQLFIERGTTFSYCAQTVWLRPVSVKENILGGNPLNEEHYTEILACCGLSDDMKALPLGDETIVNRNAMNLSKTQQYKVVSAFFFLFQSGDFN